MASKSMLNGMEFQQRMKSMKDRELLEFTANQVYETCLRCESHESRLKMLEARDHKTFGIVSALAAGLGYGIAVAVNMFVKKG